MVVAFDKNFQGLSNDDKLKVFEKMSDPTAFFTKRILNGEAEWSHLNAKQVSVLLPTFAGFSDSSKAVVANKYGAELRAVGIDQRDAFAEATKKLENNSLPEHADDFQKNLKELNVSLGQLAQIDTLVQSQTDGHRDTGLANAAAALNSASQVFDSLAGDLSRYKRQQVVVGSEIFVRGGTGHYYIGMLLASPLNELAALPNQPMPWQSQVRRSIAGSNKAGSSISIEPN